MGLWTRLKKFLSALDHWNREELVGMHERELLELEHIFALVNFGVILGLPMPPVHITGELLPYLDEELQLLFNRLDSAMDPLSELFSIFSID